MSEALSQDPESLGSGGYTTLTSSYPPTPATPSSTVQDVPPGANLPPFSTFSSEMDAAGATGFHTERLFSDTRLLDISSWDYYQQEARLLERSENGLSIIASQPQYRPWESKPIDSSSQDSLRHTFSAATPVSTFAEAFAAQNGVPKLPSFQSQFQSFNEPVTTSEPTLTTLTNLTPVSPNPSSPGSHSLTTLNSNFHTLSTVNPRNYPLVPAPIQAREIPSIQQQFLDERHIQLYSHPNTNLTTLNTAAIHTTGMIFPPQNGSIIQNSQLISSPTVVTVLKSEPDIKLATLQDQTLKIQNVGLHPTQFQNPMTAMMDNNGIYNGLDKKINGIGGAMGSPTRNDFRKKEKRKMRTSSLESSAESDGASSNMEIGSENSGQVAAVSSTAGFKSHHSLAINSSVDADEISGGNVDKQVKKKRKRCGECIGCQRKDNCGDCAPCRNDKSHQICKQRRCEKLTEKKNLYGDAGYLRGESRRGRGKGRGSGSYRGRKPSGPVTPIAGANTGAVQVTTAPEPGAGTAQPPSRPSPQPAATVHMLKPEQPVQQQPMATMPFYADPNRFSTPVWQADPTQGWPQGQFVQQIPAPGQPTLEGYPQQYPNGIYQSYQQPFETNTFYTGAVQVLSSTRPPSATNQVPLGTRSNGSYSHTPSPAPPQTPTGSTQRQQYHQEFSPNTQNYIAPATTPTGANIDNSQQSGVSRPSSVNSTVSVPTSNQNFSQQNGSSFTSVSSTNFSPNSNTNSSFVNSNMGTNSGNAQPGYPQVISSPQLVSHNSSGYPGNNEYSGNSQFQLQQQQQQQQQQQSQQQQQQQLQLQQQNWQNSMSQQSDDQMKMMWDQQRERIKDDQNGHSMYPQDIKTEDSHKNTTTAQFTQDDRINLNTKLKTMILNKQQNLENKSEQAQKVDPNNSTGHFLWYSHHRRHQNVIDDGGGVPCPIDNRLNDQNHFKSPTNIPRQHFKSPIKDVKKLEWIKKESPIKSEFNKNDVNLNGAIEKKFVYPQFPRNGEVKLRERFAYDQFSFKSPPNKHHDEDNFKQNVGTEIPVCSCFPPDQFPPEPGSYYTHLGCSDSLVNLRKDLEFRIGMNGKALRIEKVCYTGKEGKTSQGCPIAKWIIRRSGIEEKYLIVVKHRRGHFCKSAFIVICIVAWEGVEKENADDLYSLLTHKLNKFGVPTSRRCATNEPRTCACQGLDPEKCGASFSFGCSWSMYYNGCKYARSKTVRKFRLTVQNEETDVEEKMQNLANHLSPLYKTVAPNSFNNQCEFEKDASECRLGFVKGRPFSGVTACMDFCAHAHKDSHNMNNGCTVVVTLTKHRTMDKAEDEQLHVLPLYVIDETDEFGSRESQQEKFRNGSIEILNKYQCEVRVRTVPLTPCRRNKKRKDEELQKLSPAKKDNALPHYNSPTSNKSTTSSPVSPRCTTPKYVQNKSQLQSSHVSSTVLDSPESPQWRYDTNSYYSNGYNQTSPLPKFSEQFCRSENRFTVLQKSQTNTAFDHIAPYFNPQVNHRESVPREYFNYESVSSYNFHLHNNTNDFYYNGMKANPWQSPIPDYTPYNSFGENYSAGFSNHASYRVSNPFDDFDDAGYGRKLFTNWSQVLSSSYSAPMVPNYQLPLTKPKVELLGEVTDFVDNVECFKDSSIGGVAIALAHGSVLFECAKHELHATTALKQPNRQSPTRISLVFYQHRNMNRAKHGWDEWEEKTKLRKMGIDVGSTKVESSSAVGLDKKLDCMEVMLRAPTLTTISVTTLFPMYPCVVTGPYQDAAGAVRTFG